MRGSELPSVMWNKKCSIRRRRFSLCYATRIAGGEFAFGIHDGVMAIRQGDFDVAREMFQSVLERMPENALANETLYHLAEVFGIEQRFLDQLNMLRTIGRLGQQSKRWHTPGNSLFIVVHDSDLGISRAIRRYRSA